MELPSLIKIELEYDDGRNWLQGFRGAILGKLVSVTFHALSGSAPIGGFLEEFQSVALASSLQNTLSYFAFRTCQPWHPKYSSLLIFKQLRRLEIDFCCDTACSSNVGDGVIINLAQAMPKLEILQLGKEPCHAITGITLKGLVALACNCPNLSKLCVHLRAWDLAEAVTNQEVPGPCGCTTTVSKTNCALTSLQVGKIPIREQDVFMVALILIQVFPQITNIEYSNHQWRKVPETIRLIKQIGGRIHHLTNRICTSTTITVPPAVSLHPQF